MFKKTIVFVALLMTSIGSAIAAELKVGVVDMKVLVTKVPQDSLISADITKALTERNDELKALQKKGNDIQEKAKRDQMTMTNDQKLQTNRELKAIELELQMKSTFLQEDVGRVNKQKQEALLRKIKAAIDKVAVDEKLDLILVRDSVAFVAPTIDITNKVVVVLTNPAG